MASERVTITLPEHLLAQIDRLAQEGGVSRSEMVREAAEKYVVEAHADAAKRRRKSAIDRTLAFLDALDDAAVLDDRPTIEILREIRGPLERSGPRDRR